VDILIEKDLTHPADALATALDRVSGLLTVLGDLYNSRSDNFAGGNEFIVYALSTATGLVGDARGALSDLHQNCDLSLIGPATANEDIAPQRAAAVEPEPEPPTLEAIVEPMKWSIDRKLTSAAAPVTPPPPQPVSEQDQFAKSYLELLRKLTAAEVFASEQQALAAPGSATELLPLLRGLREDFQKMHNVG
jgi:hypothetical protein